MPLQCHVTRELNVYLARCCVPAVADSEIAADCNRTSRRFVVARQLDDRLLCEIDGVADDKLVQRGRPGIIRRLTTRNDDTISCVANRHAERVTR